jgi:GntR family transcriptional regulator / MocR family aminotransferase
VELFIDPTDDRGIATQIYAQLRDAISDGRMVTGDRLTPSRTLAHELGVSRFTVTDAYTRLSAEGLTRGRAGGGSVVCAMSTRAAVPVAASALAPTPRAAQVEMYSPDPTVDARYDLRPGRVDPTLFPTDTWRLCMMRALREAPPTYGDPEGTVELRTALARWVLHSRGISVEPSDIVVTSGAQHAIDLVARVLVEPGATVAVEEPGYPPVSELLRVNGANVVGVPVDDQGIVVDAIPPSARLVYVTPSHQYPLGMTLSRPRRIELLRWANVHDAAIVEDDYDSEFRYSARPLEPLQRLDEHGRVVYVGTFSKTLAPSLRIGFAAVPRTIAPALRALRQAIDWCPPSPMQAAMATFIDEGHLQRNLRRAQRTYRERRHLMLAALTDRLAGRGRVLPSDAGLHVTVLIDDQITDDELRANTRANGLRVPPLGGSYRFTSPRCGWVVGFGAIPTPDVPAAVDALATALASATRRIATPRPTDER